MSDDIQTISQSIADDFHDHAGQNRIIVSIPKKEDTDFNTSGGDRSTHTASSGKGSWMKDAGGRERRHSMHTKAAAVDQLSTNTIQQDVKGRSESDTIRSLAKDVERFRRELHFTKKELEEVKGRYRDFEQKVDALSITKLDLLQEIQQVKEREFKNHQAAQKQLQEAEERCTRQERDNVALREKLLASEGTLQHVSLLLNERTADLKAAQTFLNTADLYSGAEIINMIESLNAEVFQFSAFVAELLEDDDMAASHEKYATNERHLDTASLGNAHFFIGDQLYTHLVAMSTQLRTDPLPFQLSLQGILTGWCTYHIRAFCWGHMNRELLEIYRNIQSKEVQAVAGRWRAITTANVPLDHRDTKRLFDIILNLLHLCGWSSSSAKAQKSMLSVKDTLTRIQKQNLVLRKAIREEVITADLEVFAYTPGASFNDHIMENIYQDSSGVSNPELGSEDKRILCTVGLGLRKSAWKSDQVDIFLKPKVILQSILSDIH